MASMLLVLHFGSEQRRETALHDGEGLVRIEVVMPLGRASGALRLYTVNVVRGLSLCLGVQGQLVKTRLEFFQISLLVRSNGSWRSRSLHEVNIDVRS